MCQVECSVVYGSEVLISFNKSQKCFVHFRYQKEGDLGRQMRPFNVKNFRKRRGHTGICIIVSQFNFYFSSLFSPKWLGSRNTVNSVCLLGRNIAVQWTKFLSAGTLSWWWGSSQSSSGLLIFIATSGKVMVIWLLTRKIKVDDWF